MIWANISSMVPGRGGDCGGLWRALTKFGPPQAFVDEFYFAPQSGRERDVPGKVAKILCLLAFPPGPIVADLDAFPLVV